MERLPDFIIVGVQKGGTTSLYDAIMQHPNVFPGSRKEIHYFDWQYKMGTAWYKQQFSAVPSDCITGEATGNYIFHPHAVKRISLDLEETKFIIMLRNPIEVAYSQYAHARANWKEHDSFFNALTRTRDKIPTEIERIQQNEYYYSFIFDIYTYLERGIYAPQIERWEKVIRDKTRTIIINSNEYFTDPLPCYNKILDFLGLKGGHPITFKALKKRASHIPVISTTIYQYLKTFYKPHNQVLYKMLGWNLDWENDNGVYI